VRTQAIFPSAPERAGMYESFYMRAVSHDEPVGVWIRNTVHKAPGARPKGSVWCTVFDARHGRPYMHKLTSEQLSGPLDDWIAVGEDGEGAVLGPSRAEGRCGDARWSLRFASREPELRHLPREWMYRAPLPRTKVTSPLPAAEFNGVLELAGSDPIELRSWPGMVGHNWGAEHAERWIWTNGTDFEGHPDAYIDAAVGRITLGRLTTPWIGNGVLFVDGSLYRLGGPRHVRSTVVRETPHGAQIVLPGRGMKVSGRVGADVSRFVGWEYADPDGGGHNTVNCSIASMTLTVQRDVGSPIELHTEHGATFELGMRETDHGVPIQPFPDG
jgi:hypothetical protein